MVPIATRAFLASAICPQPSSTRAARNCRPVITKRPYHDGVHKPNKIAFITIYMAILIILCNHSYCSLHRLRYEILGAELWLNKETVRSATGWSDRTIRWKVQLGALRLRTTSNRQKRGRGPRDYALSSLPVEAQLKFLKQPLLSGPDCTALALGPDPNQSELFASLPEVTAPERLDFSAKQNAQALKRLEAIAPLVEFASRSRRSRPTFRTIGGLAVRSMNSLVGYLADQHQVSARTLWNWYAQYRKLGYAGLVDRVRSDKGKSRFLKAHPAVRAYVENKYLGERLSIRLVYQALLRDLRNLEPDCTRPPRSEEHTSELQSLSVNEALPI